MWEQKFTHIAKSEAAQKFTVVLASTECLSIVVKNVEVAYFYKILFLQGLLQQRSEGGKQYKPIVITFYVIFSIDT